MVQLYSHSSLPRWCVQGHRTRLGDYRWSALLHLWQQKTQSPMVQRGARKLRTKANPFGHVVTIDARVNRWTLRCHNELHDRARTILEIPKCELGIIFELIWRRYGQGDKDPENKAWAWIWKISLWFYGDIHIQDVERDVEYLESSDDVGRQTADYSMRNNQGAIYTTIIDTSIARALQPEVCCKTYNVCPTVGTNVKPDPMLTAAITWSAQPQAIDVTAVILQIVFISGSKWAVACQRQK